MDATQDALIAICRGLPSFDGRSAFATWAYRIATNACLDELRRRKRRPTPIDDVAVLPPRGEADLASLDATGAVGDRLTVDDALRALSPEFRAAVVLRDLVDLDYAEIGDILGIPPGTVRSRIARGRAALARALGNPDDPSRRPTPRP